MRSFNVPNAQLRLWPWLAGGYFLAALLGQWQPLVPDYASAIWPPAGVALAGLLLLGLRNWPGIWLGAMAANLYRIGVTLDGDWLAGSALLNAALIAAGSTMAAWLGGWLILRLVGAERIFFSGRKILFTLLLGGPVSCLVSALVGPLTLLGSGIITPENLTFNIFTWWLGDTIGVLVIAPLLLIWSPALGKEWQQPRKFMSGGLLIVLLLVTSLLIHVNRLERQRIHAVQRQEAERFTDDLKTSFQVVEEALHAVAGFLRLTPDVDAERFRDFTRRILERYPGIAAVEWIPRLSAEERPRLEARARLWYPDFRITERNSSGAWIDAASRAFYYPVTLVEPLPGNNQAVGFDLGSNPARLAAIEAARDSGQASATARVTLVQDKVQKIGILLLAPYYRSVTPPTTLEERRTDLLGFALGGIRIEDLVAATLARWKENPLAFEIQVIDTTPEDNLLFRTPEFSQAKGQAFVQEIRVADRLWRLSFRLNPTGSAWSAWITLVGGLFLTALLEGFLLLTVSRDIHTNNLVRQRTLDLERTQRALTATASLQRAILDSAHSTIISTDVDGRIQSFNNAAVQQLGYAPEELIGLQTPAILHDAAEVERRAALLSQEFGEQVPPGFEVFVAKARRGLPDEHEWSYIRKDGTCFPVSLTVTAMRDPDGAINGFLGVGVDITRRKQDQARLLLAHKVIENTSEAIVITDARGRFTFVNRAFEQVTGWSVDEVIGRPSNVTKSGRHDEAFYRKMWSDLAEQGNWSGEIWDRRKNGEVFPKWLSISALKDGTGQVLHYVGLFSDISQQKEAEEKLEKLAYYDPLTNLPNRVLFRERLEHSIEIAARHQSGVALFFIDLDRFKFVNDTMGHAAGDELLRIVADRLLAQVRRNDTIARLGGDEFTVILTDLTRAEQVSPIARKMIESLQLPMTIHNQEVSIGGSIGIALYPDDGEDFETLTKHADMAMYLAKERGRNNFQFFAKELQTRILERISMESDLGKALENQELLLHYQPKFDAQTRRVVGMESLVRWQKPGQGLVSPAKFIPLAEETGLILPIGEWILERSCRQSLEWRQGDQCPLQVAVNLSARQFQQPNLIGMVRSVLEQTGLPPACLELEITESMLMGNVEESVAIMKRLRELGISLAMDDFGTGYSSLNYLKKFPVNTLKIDQSFVRELRADSSDASIVLAIIGLARALHLKVVAEGVENAHQLDFLRENGCDLIQGFFLAKPMPGEAFARFVQEQGHA
ncbi:MAG: EAL domain-containing protein [Magnetococcales bacterium]|nr:EAL domain-containing protein [Magnetococcales bacterium]